MAEVSDLLQIDLVRIAGDRFDNTGSIPIPEDGDEILSGIAGGGEAREGGEVLTGVPRGPCANLLGLGISVDVSVS